MFTLEEVLDEKILQGLTVAAVSRLRIIDADIWRFPSVYPIVAKIVIVKATFYVLFTLLAVLAILQNDVKNY